MTTDPQAMTAPGGSYLLGNYARAPLAPVRGEGVWLWDEEGRRYLDFGCGIAVCSLGHCPPRVVAALRAQAGKLIHCSNLYQIRGQEELARRLVEDVVGRPGKVFFCNSGAEANEVLVKLARRLGHARAVPVPEILTFTNSFHGRTMAGVAATGQEKVKAGFGPMLPGFRHLPYNDVAAFEAGVGEETVAVMLEPVQGEGGVHVATPEFLRAVGRTCRGRGLLLLVDEVQSGLGRTGDRCAWRTAFGGSDDADFVPDAVSWAKGLGAGFPLGAVWVRDGALPGGGGEGVPALLGPGSHGTTFGGSPLAAAVGLAVLDEMVENALEKNAAEQGAFIAAAVAGWKFPVLRGLRGAGLMLGFELAGEAVRALPGFAASGAALPAGYVADRLRANGLLAVPAAGDVVRWLPPLNVARAEVEEALAIQEKTFHELSDELAAAPPAAS